MKKLIVASLLCFCVSPLCAQQHEHAGDPHRAYRDAGLPTAPYIENIGARPDIPLDYMTKENLLGRGRPYVEAFAKDHGGPHQGKPLSRSWAASHSSRSARPSALPVFRSATSGCTGTPCH